MESYIGLLAVALLIFSCLGLSAFCKIEPLRQEIGHLHTRLAALLERIRVLEMRLTAAEEERQTSVAAPGVPEEPVPAETNASAWTRDEPVSEGDFEQAAPPPDVPLAPAPESVLPFEEPVPSRKPARPVYLAQEPVPARSRANRLGAPGKGFNLEDVVGKRWLTWAGVLILFLSAAFFLKYAFERELIGPAGQVTLCALVGVALIAGGWRLLCRDMRALGQGLEGLGLAVLYVTFAAAYAVYEPPVLGQAPAFLLLVATTACGMLLAVRQNALPVALLALLGGLATPLLVSTGHNSRDTLCVYLLVLDLGVLAAAFFRQWRVLDSAALLGTYALFTGWFCKYYSPAQFEPTLCWLGGFYLLFFALPFVFHLLRRTPLTPERFTLALMNALYAQVFCWSLLYTGEREALALIALLMAVLYTAMACLFRQRIPQDPIAPLGACTLAVTLLTMALALHFQTDARILAFTVEGPALLCLGYLFAYRPLRIFAMLILALAVGWLFAFAWPLHRNDYVFVPFCNQSFWTAAGIALALAVCGVVHAGFRARADDADRVMSWGCWAGAGLLALFLTATESYSVFLSEYGAVAARAWLVCLWTAGGAGYLAAACLRRRVALCLPGVAALAIALCQAVACHGVAWPPERWPLWNLPFLTSAALLAVWVLYAYLLRRMLNCLDGALAAAVLAAAALFVLLTHEAGAYTHAVFGAEEHAERLAVTVIWGVYAAGALVVGFWRNMRWLRLCALGLLGLSAAKLLLWDMSGSDELLRIVAFVVVGLLLLAASFLYHKLEKRVCSGGADDE